VIFCTISRRNISMELELVNILGVGR